MANQDIAQKDEHQKELRTCRLMLSALSEISSWRLAQMPPAMQQAHREAVARVDQRTRELTKLINQEGK
jgi:hypothetical protein